MKFYQLQLEHMYPQTHHIFFYLYVFLLIMLIISFSHYITFTMSTMNTFFRFNYFRLFYFQLSCSFVSILPIKKLTYILFCYFNLFFSIKLIGLSFYFIRVLKKIVFEIRFIFITIVFMFYEKKLTKEFTF